MDLSIIIPIYNSEKYLGRCLESIVESLGRFVGRAEVLLVDNNSTDDSSAVMKGYQKKYPGIIYLYKQTIPGAAATRNYGASKAKGKYIWFIDADDTIRNDSISRLIKMANKESADLVMIGMERIFPDGHSNYLSAVCPNQKNYKSRFVRYGLGPVQVLIRRSWWKQHDLKFHEGIIHEDMELMSSLILYTDNFACIDEPLYNYYQNPDSVLHKSSWDEHCFDIFPALEGLYKKFEQADAAKKYHDELEWFFIWNLLIDSAKDFSKFPEGKKGFQCSRKMLKEYFPNWRKNKFFKEKSKRLRARVRLNYYK